MINFQEKGIRNLGGWNVSNVETFGEDDINSLVRVEVRNSQFEDENHQPKKNVFFLYATGESYSVMLSDRSEVKPEVGVIDPKSLSISLLTLTNPGSNDTYRIDLKKK